MFNLAIDSKLRGCDVVALRVEDVAPSGYAVDRATVRQKKTGRPVRFELTEQTRQAVDDYIKAAGKKPVEFLFIGRGNHARRRSLACPRKVDFATESPQEEDGFELVVPDFKAMFFLCFRAETGWEPRPVLMTDNGSFTVSRARLARVVKPPEGANARRWQPGASTPSLEADRDEPATPRRSGCTAGLWRSSRGALARITPMSG